MCNNKQKRVLYPNVFKRLLKHGKWIRKHNILYFQYFCYVALSGLIWFVICPQSRGVAFTRLKQLGALVWVVIICCRNWFRNLDQEIQRLPWDDCNLAWVWSFVINVNYNLWTELGFLIFQLFYSTVGLSFTHCHNCSSHCHHRVHHWLLMCPQYHPVCKPPPVNNAQMFIIIALDCIVSVRKKLLKCWFFYARSD